MKYICSICGYIYDEEKEGTLFAELPSSWSCPMCGAPKSAFEPQEEQTAPERREVRINAQMPDDGMERMSPGELSVLFSNLARGCEKQYKAEEASMSREIAAYFKTSAPDIPDAGINRLSELLRKDIKEGYPATMAAAKEAGDRGTQRVCVWGEKVTKMLDMLISRCREEGPAFLENKELWVCSVCGFVYIGDNPPEICPVCKVPSWKFEKIERREVV